MAIHNFASSKKVLPTGGTIFTPQIQYYLSDGGIPYGPEKQGLGWAFQILPYLEDGNVYALKTQADLQRTTVPMYFCPSRRAPTHNADSTAEYGGAVLMDYAGATPLGIDRATGLPWPKTVVPRDAFWQTYAKSRYQILLGNKDWFGMIVRTPLWKDETTGDIKTPVVDSGSTRPITFSKVTDGTSKTILIGEKTVNPKYYQGGTPSDDRGWSDGWDPDTIRCTCAPPLSDGDAANLKVSGYEYGVVLDAYNFGSAHTGGFNAAMGDASVQTISYDVDPLIFDRLGDRRDGESVDQIQL